MSKLVPILIAAALGACAGGGYYATSGSVSVTATAPDMAYVSPGVRVIADYDEPIFFSNGYYWYNADGYWYRSSTYTGGWAYVSSPPTAILRIERPYAYVHYRPHNYVVHRRPVPSYRIERPMVRDHRAARRGGVYYRTR
jgi:hypothetical protein